MEQEPIKAADELFEKELDRLRSQLEACRKKAGLCSDECDPVKKAESHSEIEHELNLCERGLEGIAEVLDSLQGKKRELQVLASEVTAVLERSRKTGRPYGDEDFSPSSISPLA